MPEPLVSVLTPSRNQARWLVDNLRSVGTQTYPHIEHVVFDGASEDGTVEILEKTPFAVRWRSEPDGGQSHALNKAFLASKGDVIGWLNSDDAYFSQDAVASAIEAFEANPHADVVYGHAALVDESGELLHLIWAPPNAQRLMRFHNFLVQPAVFVRRRAVIDHFVDETMHSMMDWDLWLRLADTTRFQRIDDILAIDRHQRNRKVVTEKGTALAEQALLASRYSLQRRPWTPITRKALTVGFRLVGASLVQKACRTNLAFRGRAPAWWTLLGRQLLRPRSRMRFGEPKLVR